MSSYFDELIGAARARYEVKVQMCDNVDPYRLSIGSDATKDADLLPSTTYADILNYIVLTANFVTHEEMKAYKSLDAHNFFTSGWVKGIAVKQLPSKRVIVPSEVSLREMRVPKPEKVVYTAVRCAYPGVLRGDAGFRP